MKTLKLVKVYAIIVLYTLIFAAELFGSQVTQSLVLLVDSYHNLYTILSLLLLVISHKLTNARTLKNTFGWARIEILGSLFNAIFFTALCFSLVVGAVQTLAHSGHEDVVPSHPIVLAIAGIAGFTLHLLLYFTIGDLVSKEGGFLSITGNDIFVNRVVTSGELAVDAKDSVTLPLQPQAAGVTQRKASRSRACCPNEDGGEARRSLLSTNRPTQVQHDCESPVRGIVRDYCSSMLLIATGAVILFTTGWTQELADACFSLVAVALLGFTFYPAMKQSGLILLQTVPKHIDVNTLKKAILVEFPDILQIHEIHVWGLNRSQVIATCHVTLPQHTSESYTELSLKLEEFLERKGITLATVQPEFEQAAKNSYSCLYKCKSNTESECLEKKCCHENDDECEAVLIHSHKK